MHSAAISQPHTVSAHRQERAAAKLDKSHNRSAAMLLLEHLAVAVSAFELSTKMPGMQMNDYMTYATKLDNAQITFPSSFCVQAILHRAQSQLLAGGSFRDISDMFVLKMPNRLFQAMFKAAAPRLHNIKDKSPAEIEEVLGDGLFGIVIVHFMNLTDGVPSTAAAAKTLRDGCAIATLMASAGAAPAAATEPSIIAGSGMVASRTTALPADWAWISELQDIAIAVLCLATDDDSPESLDTLCRVQESMTGRGKVLAKLLKKEHWAKRMQETWMYGIGSFTIKPKVQEALTACASDPEAWMKAAALIPVWKAEVRPGTTDPLEDLLWQVLLADWESFDAGDQSGSTALVERLRLARHLQAPHCRPDDATIDMMEITAPRPQLIMPAQSCRPKLQPQAPLRLQWHTLCHTVCCLAKAG